MSTLGLLAYLPLAIGSRQDKLFLMSEAKVFGEGISQIIIPEMNEVFTLEALTGSEKDQGYVAGNLTNSFRQENGLGPLTWNDLVYDQAYQHSKDMALGVVPFGHDGFDQRINNLHIRICGAAENVAQNYDPNAATAINQWKNSAGHRANMLGSYNEIGVGSYCNSKGACYWTMMLIHRC